MFIFMQIANKCRCYLYFKGFYDVYLEMYFSCFEGSKFWEKNLLFLENDYFIFLIYKIQKTRKVCYIQYAGKRRQKFQANIYYFD